MAANVAHKDAWHRRHQGTRSVDGATVVGQDFVGDPIALGPGADIAVACPSGQVAPDARIRLGRRGAGTVVHKAIEHLSLPYDPASRRLFGVPIVATVSEAAGVGHVLATRRRRGRHRHHGVGVQWSETSNADDFSKNLIRARCEGRFGTSVLLRWASSLRPDRVMSVESPAVLAMLGADKHAIFAGRPSLAVAVAGPVLADELAWLPTNMASKSVELTHVLEYTGRGFAVREFMQQREYCKGCCRYTMVAIRRRINAGSQPSNAGRGSRTLNGDPPASAGCPRRDSAAPRPGHGRRSG